MLRFDVDEANLPGEVVLTNNDIIRFQQGLPLEQYDAFVLYADEDNEFATELIDHLEENHFKFCLKDRDIIKGLIVEDEAICRLIAERCNRLVVIVSTAFLRSSANRFSLNFVQGLQIEQRLRKIVPCLYEECVLPPDLAYNFCLKYNSDKAFNFWEKLSDTIRSRSTNIIANGNAVDDNA